MAIGRRDDLTLRLLYLAVWAAVGSFWPYLNVHYRAIGLSGAEIGLIGAAGSLASVIGATGWAMLHDRTGKTRLLLTGLSASVCVLCLTLAQLRSFAALLPTFACFTLFASGIVPLLDSTTLRFLGQHKEAYGTYRMWGTIGFVITSATSGFVVARVGFLAAFIAYTSGIGLFGLLSQRLPDQPIREPVRLFAGLKTLVQRPQWPPFTVSVFLLWLSAMAAWAFLGIYIMEMGGSAPLVGLASTVSALAEIPFFRYSSTFLRRFGPGRLVMLAMVIYGVRMILLGMMPAVSWVLWINLLQGLSYGPFLIGSVAYANRLAPAELQATSQGLLAATMSLANLGSGIIGGQLFDHASRLGMYATLAAGCAAALLVFATGQRLQSAQEQEQHEPPP